MASLLLLDDNEDMEATSAPVTSFIGAHIISSSGSPIPKGPMRSRLDSDTRSNTPFLRSRSPYKQLDEASDENHDQFYLSQRSDPVEDDTSNSSKVPITVTLTQSQSNPPSPTSFVSFNSSTSSVNDPFTLHPMTSDISISSSRSMPVQSTRSAVELYVYHDIKPKTLTRLRRPKPKALFLSDNSPDLEAAPAESVWNHETGSTSPRISRSSSVSSSLRVLSGSLRRKWSARVAAPAVTVTPSTPTPMSPLSPLDPPSETERRLRQLHKVTRTLGENIPAELIFGPSHEDESPLAPKPSARYKPRRSISLTYAPLIIPPTDEPITMPTSTPSSPDRPSSMAFEVEFINNTRPGSLVSPITFAIPNLPPTPPRFVHALPDFPEDVSANGSPHSPISPTTPEEKVNPFMIIRPDTPFMNTAVPVETMVKLGSDSEYLSAVRRERRQGWSGEWNRQDMQDVIAQLRTL